MHFATAGETIRTIGIATDKMSRPLTVLCGLALAAAGFSPVCRGASPSDLLERESRESGVTALVVSKLSTLGGVKVVRRDQLHLLPHELVRTDSESGRRELSRTLAADILLLIDPRRIAFGFIDAQTGEELFRIREDTPEWLAVSAFALVQEQRDVQTVRQTVVIVLENPGFSRAGIFNVRRGYLTDFSNHSAKAFGPPAR